MRVVEPATHPSLPRSPPTSLSHPCRTFDPPPADKFYYVYGFLFLVFLILTTVTVCVTIVVTYFLLNNEDYR